MLAYFRSRGWDEVDVQAVLEDPEVDVESPEELEHLDLTDNGLRDLASLAPFSRLASVNVSSNRIEAIDHLPSRAQRVIAPHNCITSLQALAPHSHLAVLDVSHNPLSTVRNCAH